MIRENQMKEHYCIENSTWRVSMTTDSKPEKNTKLLYQSMCFANWLIEMMFLNCCKVG